MKNTPTSYEVTVKFEGNEYSAHYSVTSTVVTVNSIYGSKSAQIGGSSASLMAGILFREILQSAKDLGELSA